MTGSYAESTVKRISTPSTIAAKIGVIVGILLLVVVLSFLLIAFGGPQYIAVPFVLVLGGGFAVYYILPRFNVEYEYVFVDGQLDFDIIYNQEKRKRGLRIDFDTVEIMAPENSHELDSLNRANAAVKDFSSRNTESKNRYVVFWRSGEKLTKIIFEPGEKMIEAIRNKCPRKLKMY